MKAKPQPTLEEYLLTLTHPKKDVVEFLRDVVLKADKRVKGHVKWNSPAFYFDGELAQSKEGKYARDVVVLNLNKKEFVLLIFPTGVLIDDESGILEGDYKDGRRMITVNDIADAKVKSKAIVRVVKKWIENVTSYTSLFGISVTRLAKHQQRRASAIAAVPSS